MSETAGGIFWTHTVLVDWAASNHAFIGNFSH